MFGSKEYVYYVCVYICTSSNKYSHTLIWASLVAQVVKNLLANAGHKGDSVSIPGSGRYPGEGNDNPLQYFLLGKFHGLGGLAGKVHGVASSWA